MRRFNIDVAETLEHMRGKEAASVYVADCIRRSSLAALQKRMRRSDTKPRKG